MSKHSGLIFSEIPQIKIETNTYICRIPIRYKDEAMIEFVQEEPVPACAPNIPIYHADGTKLAVVRGSRLFRTDEGKKAGIESENRDAGQLTVCSLGGKPIIEMRRTAAAALKMDAELRTFDGFLLKWSEKLMSHALPDCRQALSSGFIGCIFKAEVGIQIGKPDTELGAAVRIRLPGE